MDIENITESEEELVAKWLVEEIIKKNKDRRMYMKQYYQERKRNGFIKCIKKENKLESLIIERGNYVVEFN
jgi:hypothetical protein